jgi:predicted DNA-binding transcriptional regulator AlpA
MSESVNSLEEVIGAIVKKNVKEAVFEAMNQRSDEDRLLDATEAAKMLSVSEDWLYRNAKKLPFTRKLGPKMLRFSHLGIKNYLARAKFS